MDKRPAIPACGTTGEAATVKEDDQKTGGGIATGPMLYLVSDPQGPEVPVYPDHLGHFDSADTFITVGEAAAGLRESGCYGYSINTIPVATEPWRDYGDEHKERP